MAFLLELLVVIITSIVLLISWVTWMQSYWQRRGLETPPKQFLFGHSQGIFFQFETFGKFTAKVYNYFKRRNNQHGGFYLLTMSLYMPVDPHIVKNILQNDFIHFMDRGVYFNETDDPLSAHLFALEGTKWKNLRTKLTPTFTSGKMKMMFDTVVKCGDQLVVELKKMQKNAVNVKEVLSGFTTDVIGNCAFGIDCNSVQNPNNKFTYHSKLFFTTGFLKNIVDLLTFVAPKLMRRLKVKAVQPVVSDFFMNIVKETVDYREKNNLHRKDFMHLLLQLKNRGKLVDDGSILETNEDEKNEITLSLDELAAQAFVFFIAGYETSSTTMTFCLLELALNPEVQNKLRQETVDVLEKHNNKLTYETIMEMQYMDQVINETLRKYPPLPCLNRMCTKEYHVPGTDVIIEEGTKLIIPVLGLHYDPEYFPNPEEFNPDRFSDENKNAIHSQIFLPFGIGPRLCIGLRFGMMQTKVGLSMLLKNFKFTLNSQTKMPLEFDPKSFITTTKGGVWLNCMEIEK